jgi:hypothetical protein
MSDVIAITYETQEHPSGVKVARAGLAVVPDADNAAGVSDAVARQFPEAIVGSVAVVGVITVE